MGADMGRLHHAPIWPGGLGAAPSDEADRTTTSADRRANSPLYGRDCGGMLGGYAADYAALELTGTESLVIYRIDYR